MQLQQDNTGYFGEKKAEIVSVQIIPIHTPELMQF